MGAFIIVAAIMISAAVLSDRGASLRSFDLDRVPPSLPENVAVYGSLGSDEPPRGSEEDPDSCTTIQHRLIALAH